MKRQKRGLIILSLILILVFNAQHAYSQNYYADVEIKIDERGVATITGTTNDPELLGTFQGLTTKTEKYWIFNLTTNNYTNALFKVTLPEETVMTYIKSTAQINIGAEGDSSFIKGILKNKPLEILIQYYFEEPEEEEKQNYSLLILSIIVMLLGAYLLFKKKNKKQSHEDKGLTRRQRQIISILEKKQETNQKYLEEKLGLPKSSVSRNVASLERKGILTKTQTGYSNIIKLKKNKES